MCTKCKIQWIDEKGNPTPDDNPAIGVVWLPKRHEWIAGRRLEFPETEHYPICAEHAKELSKPDMHQWQFAPY